MAKLLKRSLCVSVLLATGAAGVLAQSSGDKPLFQWGGDFRFRYEGYNNVHTLRSFGTHDRDYLRSRLRLWETTNPFPSLSLFGRVSAEPRYWFNAASTVAEGEEWKYGILDNFYAKWTTESDGMPITVTIGRQDIQLGEQWLVTDGTPLDGSWTNHFDGLRATINAKDYKTTFELIAFDQQAAPGDRMPVLGRRYDLSGKKYLLQEQDETGVIVYVSNKSLKNTQVDGYFIYKGDDAVASSLSRAGYNADIFTFGGRVAGTPGDHWQYSAEAAYQWGERRDATFTTDRDVSAYGANAKLTYSFKDELKNQVTFVAEYLSGDKAGTGKDEMFDVLWGRTPRISEVWAVAIGQDVGRNGQYQNLFRLGGSWSIAPTKNTTVTGTYNALFAPEVSPTRTTSALFSRDSHFRGHMFQLVVKQKFTKQLSGLILGEWCPMGGYYTHKDQMTFVRAEMLVTF